MAENQDNRSLVMEIAEVRHIRGVGTCVIGTVVCDRIAYKDKVVVEGIGFTKELTVGGVEAFRKTNQRGERGETVGMLLIGDVLRELVPGVSVGMKIYRL